MLVGFLYVEGVNLLILLLYLLGHREMGFFGVNIESSWVKLRTELFWVILKSLLYYVDFISAIFIS